MNTVTNGNGRARALVIACALGLVMAVGATAINAQKNYVELPTKVRVIELVICLDASGSMDGLIDAAKQKIWAIVNELALAEPTPELRVALFTYGNDGHETQDGWVALQTPFTGDLDLVSERLFAVTTNGGTEYVGRVLQAAGRLKWSPADEAMQLIVVAGNESAEQDTAVSFRAMCAELIGRGILVNAIYCGSPEDGIATAWREVAQLADGTFASIDQNTGTIVIATPFDDRLGVLSSSLNLTYIPFGASGVAGAANQEAQDLNAANMNSSTQAARAMAKSSALYTCSWDLIDACQSGKVKLADLKTEDLPEEMQDLSAAERQAYIDGMATRRNEIKERIAELSAQRDNFVTEEMKRLALDDSKAFDNVIRQAIRAQALARGFSFKDGDKQPRSDKSAPSRSEVNTSVVQFAAAVQPPVPFRQRLTLVEATTLRGVFARAMSVRPGTPKSDIRTVAAGVRVVPDVVVTIGSQDDWRLLRRVLNPSLWTDLPGQGEMLVWVDGQAILFVSGC